MRSQWENISECHRLIWPGYDVVQLQSKNMTKKRKKTEDQDVWLREHTLSTSSYVSLMYFTMTCKFRKLVDRAHACDKFCEMMNFVVSTLGGMNFEITPFGSNDNQLGDCFVDATGMVNANLFWTEEFYYRHARGAWTTDYSHNDKTWVTSKHGIGRIHICQLICFCLDPQHTSELRNKVSQEVLNLFSQFACLVDDSVGILIRDADTLDYTDQLENKHRARRSVKTIWIEKIAARLWNNDS